MTDCASSFNGTSPILYLAIKLTSPTFSQSVTHMLHFVLGNKRLAMPIHLAPICCGSSATILSLSPCSRKCRPIEIYLLRSGTNHILMDFMLGQLLSGLLWGQLHFKRFILHQVCLQLGIESNVNIIIYYSNRGTFHKS